MWNPYDHLNVLQWPTVLGLTGVTQQGMIIRNQSVKNMMFCIDFIYEDVMYKVRATSLSVAYTTCILKNPIIINYMVLCYNILSELIVLLMSEMKGQMTCTADSLFKQLPGMCDVTLLQLSAA